ncbi:MAG TPA: putative LPS assembly protein LptD, partial [Bacteroidales bacterium]|nr:putative LPS assembly protein LptD [Bacteroidales bacterium]
MQDSIITQNGDTTKLHIAKSSQAIDKKVDYQSKDSLVMEMKNKKITLYENAKVVYGDLTLTAGIIKIDFDKNLVYAYGIFKDSLYSQRPNFVQGTQSFLADSLVYNINTEKGLVYNVYSKQGDGYLHGKYIKRENDSVILVKTGGFTTCELTHPHYIIRFDKAKVITDKEIITGPVWLEIEDITLPIGLPMGFFPTQTKRKSGILIPTFGESANRGFFLENGGYYFGISDYVDLALRGDIYSRGSWALKTETNYKKRYKYEGNFQASFAHNKFGEKGFSNYEVYNDFFVRWTHKQDPKAHPTNRFNANVQLGSSNYNKFNPSSANDYLSNT